MPVIVHILKEISDFSTSVMWRNLKLIHMWMNFRLLHICHVQKFEISPHDRFFLHGPGPWACDKYEVCWILTDTANKAIQGNVAMHVAPRDGQTCNYASSATCWPKLEPMQVRPSDCESKHQLLTTFTSNTSSLIWSGGQIYNKCKRRHLVAKLGTKWCHRQIDFCQKN